MGRWVVVAVAGLTLASGWTGVRAEEAPSGARGRLGAVHCYLHPLDCADPAALTCGEACEVAFDACVGRNGEAGRSGRCQVDVVRCKGACAKEAPPPADTAAVPRSPFACRDTCRTQYKECLAANGKRSSRCETAELRCRQACPREVVAAASREDAPPAPPRPEARAGLGGATAAGNVMPDSTSQGEEPAAVPSPTLESAAVADAPAPPAARTAPASDTTDAASEDGVFHQLWCLVNPACAGITSAATSSCTGNCESEYEACRRAASSRTSNECSTAIMRCRRQCRDGARNNEP